MSHSAANVAFGADGKPEYIRAWIDGIQFLDYGLEIGKVLNALASEFLFPLQGGDDLDYELQPQTDERLYRGGAETRRKTQRADKNFLTGVREKWLLRRCRLRS